MIIDYHVRVVVVDTVGPPETHHYFRTIQTDKIDETKKEPSNEGKTHRDFVIEFEEINAPTCVGNSPSDLDIRTNVGSAIVNDDYAVTAHATLKKFIKTSLARDDTSGLLEILAFEKTTGDYDDTPAGKTLIYDLKEFSVVALGLVLVEEEDYI